MSTVDPLQEISDLKRKLRLIKGKLLDPNERNIRQAISMIDDTFATEEVHMSCSRIGITCTPPAMFTLPSYPPPVLVPETGIEAAVIEPPTMADTHTQTKSTRKYTVSTQTKVTGDIDFTKSELYNTTQSNIQQAIDLLTETKVALSPRGKKRKVEGSSARTTNNSIASLSSPALIKNVTHLQRIHQLSESKPMPQNTLPSSEKLAITNKSTPKKDKTSDTGTVAKRQKIRNVDFACKYCCYSGDEETDLFYHECLVLPEMNPPFHCCGTGYKHKGYYTRHRDLKHKKAPSTP